MLGIIRGGYVFVPLDNSYPLNRLSSMLQTSDTNLLIHDQIITSEALKSANKNLKTKHIELIIDEKSDTDNLKSSRDSFDEDDDIYIYFTSGTSGKPKSILGRNESLLHFINWEIKELNITKEDKVSQFTSPCHDPYLRDILVPLLSGATICIPPSKEVMLSSEDLIKWIDNEKLTLIHCTPSLFSLVNTNYAKDKFSNLRYIMLAGEKINPKALSSWYKMFGEKVQLINAYGPTETTLAKMVYFIKPYDINKNTIPIGKPIDGCKAIPVDSNLNVCSNGEKGELLIRTAYKTKGYYNDDNLNREKFISNPFSNDENDIVYRTGDLVRVLADGNYEFIGRKDRQIKIRGIRIELEEIESVLNKYDPIKQCVVDFRKINLSGKKELKTDTYINGDSEKVLIAYYMSEQEISENEFKLYLSKFLPEQAIPLYYIQIEKFQITNNGKIDYSALSSLIPLSEENIVQPSTETEEKLVQICCEVLNIDKISVEMDFIKANINSIKVMSIITKIYKIFEFEFPISQFFKHPNIKSLGEYIDNNSID